MNNEFLWMARYWIKMFIIHKGLVLNSLVSSVAACLSRVHCTVRRWSTTSYLWAYYDCLYSFAYLIDYVILNCFIFCLRSTVFSWQTIRACTWMRRHMNERINIHTGLRGGGRVRCYTQRDNSLLFFVLLAKNPLLFVFTLRINRSFSSARLRSNTPVSMGSTFCRKHGDV